MTPASADFFRRDPVDVAPDLLGATLRVGECAGRIVEVEAYRGADDPAAHTFKGPTPRTATMFGPPGGLYVYFSYGMHWCANAVCGDEGRGDAVLLRAVAPTDGLDTMWARRPAARRERDLCSGPAKLCAAFGIDGSHDGLMLTDDEGQVRLFERTEPPAEPVLQVPRIGITKAVDRPWRWYLDDPNVSKR